jgi:hypothetical protein
MLFSRIHTIYGRMGAALEIGHVPERPARRSALVVVPVGGMSRLVREGISAALSIGDEVIAVNVCYDDPEDDAANKKLHEQWEQWKPGARLVTLHTSQRSLGPPIVAYLRELEQTNSRDELLVLIPEIQAVRPWQRVLHNQRGFVLEQAIQHGTNNVIIARLRYRLDGISSASGSG